jgi:general secretion pathway protein E
MASAPDIFSALETKLHLGEDQIKRLKSLYLVESLPLRVALEKIGVSNENEVLKTLSAHLGLKLLERKDYPEHPVTLENISLPFLHKNFVLPVSMRDNQVTVAVNDPFDLPLLSAVESRFPDRKVAFCLGRQSDISMAIDRMYGAREEEDLEAAGNEGPSDSALLEGDLEQLKNRAKEAPVVRRVDFLINRSLDMRASDIHFEPFEGDLVVRSRVDGILHVLDTIPKNMQAAILSRLKLMSNLDIAERRLPQDGAIKWRFDDRQVDIRVSTAPTLYGESVVLRLLSKEHADRGLEHLGMSPEQLQVLEGLIVQANGMILVTGPTGSGKTSTLYGVLQKIKDESKKIITVEDPVEYKIDGINQIQVKPQINLTFATALRSLVRQDPDVLLIGEIRDQETVNIAIESALTGHLVLSTLHTKNAPGAITRMRDLGAESFLIADSLLAVLAQRLVRLLCPACKKPYQADAAELAQLRQSFPRLPDKVTLHRPGDPGCKACGSTGFKGRQGIFEILLVGEAVRSAVVAGKDAGTIADIATPLGYRTMLEHGYRKVLEGTTTISEILRVTSLS